jgi:hypothetical protein
VVEAGTLFRGPGDWSEEEAYDPLLYVVDAEFEENSSMGELILLCGGLDMVVGSTVDRGGEDEYAPYVPAGTADDVDRMVWISEEEDVDDVVDATDASETCWKIANGDELPRAGAPGDRLGLR